MDAIRWLIMNKRKQKWKHIVRHCKSKKITQRFQCSSCKIVYDSGWVYFDEENMYYFCYRCRNEYMPGKMQRWRLFITPFETNKNKH